MSPSVSADVFGEQPGLDSIPQATDLPAQSHTTTSLSVGELWAGGGAAVGGDGDDKAAADGTDETGIGRSGATGGGFGGTRDPTTRHPVPGGQQTTQEDGGYFAIPRAPSRGRVRTRATTPRAPTLPIIPSSRASPVLGPVKPGGFAGLGLMTKLSLAAAEDDDDVDDLADRQDEDDARLCAPLHAVVALPPTPRSRGPLHPGATWSGTQRSGRASYGVSVTFTHIDLTRGVGGGYLRISQLTRELPELVTYFDAEIIGDRHGFLTGKYGASESDDWKHWSRFPPFRTLAKPAILKERAELKDKERATQSAKKEDGDGGTASEGSQDGSEADGREEGKPINKMPFAHLNRPVVFMRWKERFVVPNHRTRDIQGASFAGFYYVCCDLTPPPELPPLSPAIASPVPPSARPQRSSSVTSVASAPDTAQPYLSRTRQRSTSRNRTTTSSPAPAPSPSLPTVAMPPAAPRFGPVPTAATSGQGASRQRRASTPGGFSYAAIARRNSNASTAAAPAPSVPSTDVAPASPQPASASLAEPLDDAAKADEPVTAPAAPSVLSWDDFPPPTSPVPASPSPSSTWRPLTGSGISETGRRRMSSTPLPSLARDEPASDPPVVPRAATTEVPVRGGWQDARITAYYCHANSEPYQELVLKYLPPFRGGSGDYQFA